MRVGVYCSSIRPHLWVSLYESLSLNSVDFNICIVGPSAPMESLPGNVRYIQSNVKPAQCYFIASQNVEGDYIINIPDDVTFSPGSLDDLVKMIDGKMDIASAQYTRVSRSSHWEFRDKRIARIKKKITFIALKFPIPVCSMMRREAFNSIGIDKHYISMNWDIDIALELISRGGNIMLSDKSTVIDIKTAGSSKVGGDYAYLTDIWFDVDKIRNKRKVPIDPLVYNDDVLTISQGRKGKKWK